MRTLGNLSLRNVRTVISGSDFIIPSSDYQSCTHQNEFLVVLEISLLCCQVLDSTDSNVAASQHRLSAGRREQLNSCILDDAVQKTTHR